MGETCVLCRADELASGEARRFDVGGHRIALVRIGDDFYALGDRCSHEDYSLPRARCGPTSARSSARAHGSTFDLRTGEPARCRPPPRCRSTRSRWRATT